MNSQFCKADIPKAKRVGNSLFTLITSQKKMHIKVTMRNHGIHSDPGSWVTSESNHGSVFALLALPRYHPLSWFLFPVT